MKKIIIVSLGAGLVLGLLGRSARATDPRPLPPINAGKAAVRVLVLDNERTLTGEIERVGDRYRIKRLIGETWIPTAKVLHLCSSMEEAYQFLKRRANLADVDERLRLADWCRQHALRAQAAEEAQAALKLRPNDERVRRLATHLQESKARSATPSPARPAERAAPRAEVSSESLGLFATKVQPILMNACVSCHNPGRGSAFQLTRVYGPGMSNRRSTEQNLAAALAHLNAKDPSASKLLSKSVSIHGTGMTQAPLKGRTAAAFQSLEAWVMCTLETNPSLRDEAPAPTSSTAPRGEVRFGQDRASTPAPAPTPIAPPLPVPPPPVPSLPKPPPRPESMDPVDPDGFNREFHPTQGAPR